MEAEKVDDIIERRRMEQWEAVKKEKEQRTKMKEEQRRARDFWLEAQEEELRMANLAKKKTERPRAKNRC